MIYVKADSVPRVDVKSGKQYKGRVTVGPARAFDDTCPSIFLDVEQWTPGGRFTDKKWDSIVLHFDVYSAQELIDALEVAVADAEEAWTA